MKAEVRQPYGGRDSANPPQGDPSEDETSPKAGMSPGAHRRDVAKGALAKGGDKE